MTCPVAGAALRAKCTVRKLANSNLALTSHFALRTSYFVLAALLFPLLFASSLAQHNVVLITIDTLRADHLEAYGYTKGHTPAISALARDGVTFENTLVQTPITLPSHASILTGTYPTYHLVQDVVGRLRDGVPTLAQWFKEKGYATGAFVGSAVLVSQWGLDRGFDTYNDDFQISEVSQIEFDRVERPAEKVIEPARQWLAKNANKPFFLWIHLYDPHHPYTPPQPFASEFKDWPYDGEIAYVDAALSTFFKFLKDRNLYEQSLVVFTADHGEGLGEHEEEYHGYFIYDASLRVPLILKFPGSQFRGRPFKNVRLSNQVRSVDVAPTIIQLMGERVPGSMQGEGLLRMLLNREDAGLPAYAESHYARIHFGWSPLFSYSTAKYKYIDAPAPELYDLEKDPGELHNIFESNQALANRLKEELRAFQKKFSVQEWNTSETSQLDQETLERLKSLGYLAFSAGTPTAKQNLPDPKEKIAVYNQLNRATSLSREGRSKEAVVILERVAGQEPEMAMAHFMLGSEHFSSGQYLMAIEKFRQTLEQVPHSAVARFNLARSYFRAGLTVQAEESLRELIRQSPQDFAARQLLAASLAGQGRFQEAIAEQLKAIEVRPDSAQAHNNLGSYYLRAEQTPQAVQALQKALEQAPDHRDARANLTVAYLKLGRFDEALEQAQILVQQAPQYALSHFYLGRSYLAKGMRAQAQAAFRRAREIDPKLDVPRP